MSVFGVEAPCEFVERKGGSAVPDSHWKFKIGIVVATGLLLLAIVWWAVERRDAKVATTRLVKTEDPGAIEGDRIDREAATRLFPAIANASNRYILDPRAVFRPLPGFRAVQAFPEHPEGEFVVSYNNLGFRESSPTEIAKAPGTVRILVAGDSHVEAVVSAEETYPNVLDRQVHGLECLNAGVGGTGPHQYLGILRCFTSGESDLDLDGFIATIYLGNDFVDALRSRAFFEKRRTPPMTSEQERRLEAAAAAYPGVAAQCLFQAFVFAHRDGDAEYAWTAARDALVEMRDVCRRRGIAFIVVLLPAKDDVDARLGTRYDDCLAELQLDEEQASVHLELGARLGEALRSEGISVVDPIDAMRAESEPLYWESDHHLTVRGHALLADLVRDELAALRLVD